MKSARLRYLYNACVRLRWISPFCLSYILPPALPHLRLRSCLRTFTLPTQKSETLPTKQDEGPYERRGGGALQVGFGSWICELNILTGLQCNGQGRINWWYHWNRNRCRCGYGCKPTISLFQGPHITIPGFPGCVYRNIRWYALHTPLIIEIIAKRSIL